MSRLSLKPGGEPGQWILGIPRGCFGHGAFDSRLDMNELGYVPIAEVPDTDLIAIQRTITEYFEAQEPASEAPKQQPIWVRKPWIILAATPVVVVFAFAAIFGAFWFLAHPPAYQPTSTGGVIDQLCMRPEIECSTEIRYAHPLKSGVVEQEYDTFPRTSEDK